MDSAESGWEITSTGTRWRPSLAVTIVLVILLLSLMYAIVFSRLVFISMVEESMSPHHQLPRYATPPHSHNTAEWLLLFFPALLGWVGTIYSLSFLARRIRIRVVSG